MEKIRVAMCDDYEYLCVNMKNQFKYYDDIEFIGYCTSPLKCAELIQSKQPDILLLDVQFDNKYNGIDIIEDILDIKHDLKIIMLTSYEDSDFIFRSITNGAADYIIKSDSIDEIVAKIKSVYANTATLSPKIAEKFKLKSKELVTAHKSLIYLLNKIVSLSPTEFDVLREIYNGKTYTEIAAKRFVETTTVRSMCSRILKKFGCDSMNTLINELQKMHIFDLFLEL